MDTSKLGLLLLTATLACKASEPAPASQSSPATQPAPATLVSSYLALGELLATDSVTDAGTHAQAILTAAEPRRDQPGVPAMSASLGQQGQFPNTLEPARASYRALSQAMLEYLDAHPDERAGLTLVYCPMTFANKGAYWVQRAGTINNPYEGSRMLTCGAKLSWEEGQAHRARWAAAQAPVALPQAEHGR